MEKNETATHICEQYRGAQSKPGTCPYCINMAGEPVPALRPLPDRLAQLLRIENAATALLICPTNSDALTAAWAELLAAVNAGR